jgi:hypothetical protein
LREVSLGTPGKTEERVKVPREIREALMGRRLIRSLEEEVRDRS